MMVRYALVAGPRPPVARFALVRVSNQGGEGRRPWTADGPLQVFAPHNPSLIRRRPPSRSPGLVTEPAATYPLAQELVDATQAVPRGELLQLRREAPRQRRCTRIASGLTAGPSTHPRTELRVRPRPPGPSSVACGRLSTTEEPNKKGPSPMRHTDNGYRLLDDNS